jgi:D-alanyl-D-alanine carboxypeptidase (penicillin-binding protein 5/6)
MKALGATQTNLTNATGWPDPEHLTTAHDLALIARQTIELFPSLYSQFYGKNEFVYNNIRQMNRNPLLYKNIGTDGLKTGHTDTAGYGLIVSAQQDGERFILVINGLETKSARAQEAEKLMRWALIRYATLKLFGQGEIVDTANVWLGEQKAVPLVTHKDLYATILRCNLGKVLVEIVYRGPITAPIKKGDQLALVRLTSPELQIFIETPLFAGKDIEVAGVFSRISKAIHRLVFGWSRGKEALHAQG